MRASRPHCAGAVATTGASQALPASFHRYLVACCILHLHPLAHVGQAAAVTVKSAAKRQQHVTIRMSVQQTGAPASSSAWTTGALRAGMYQKAGQAAVVGKHATSMLSFTAKGTPHKRLRADVGTASSCLQVRKIVFRYPTVSI